MKRQAYELDNGYIKDIHVVDCDDNDIPLEPLPENFTLNAPPDGLYRAKWTGENWTEDMTQEEIDELNNQHTPPTPEQRLSVVEDTLIILDDMDMMALEAIAQTYEENLALKDQNTQMEQRLTMAESDTIVALEGTAELYETLVMKGVL